MPHIIRLTSLQQSEALPYSSLTERQLRHHGDDDDGLFIAESPKVILTALQAGYEPVSLLCEERHISGDAAPILERCEDLQVLTGSRELLAQLTGYTLTRGVLCAMRRKPLPTMPTLCKDARRIAVIDGVCDTTNIGAIFRSAAALGIDAVLLTPDACDPLNRRSIRVSMGSVFLVPWTWITKREEEKGERGEKDSKLEKGYCNTLRQLGFSTAAMALTDDSISLDDPLLKQQQRLAIILGTEGDGLPKEVITAADYVVRIPMAHGVDSLNVAAAAAVAFWEMRRI